MFEQKFKNIDDVLQKEANCATELDYAEQISWIFFLKYLDDLEIERENTAFQNIKPFEIVLKKMDYVAPQKAEELDKHSFRKGDIIVTKLGLPLGISAIVENINKGIIVADLVRVRTDPNKINTKYLCYHLNSTLTNSFLNSQQRGTTRPRIRISVIRELPILTPPLEEQRRIVEILDEAFEGIAIAEVNTKKNLANARELFDSYLNKVFNNSKNTQWVTLSDLCVAITDGDRQPPPKASEGIPLITISNIDKQNRTIDFSDTFKVSPGYFNKLKEHREPLQGDILYTVTGSYGIPVIVDDEKKFCFQRHIGLIRPNKQTKSRFLYYLLLSKKVKKQADKCATGTAQKTVGLRSLRKFIVPKISLDDRIEITKKLDDTLKEVIRLEEIYQRKLEALAELKQSILQKAFTGQFT